MKNVLLPTDLSVISLWPLHRIALDAGDARPRVQIVHLLSLPDSIGDLFTARVEKPWRSVPRAFLEALELMRHRYADRFAGLHLRFEYGATRRFLRNLVEGQGIDAVYRLGGYEYRRPLPRSLRFDRDLDGVPVPLHEVPLREDAPLFGILSPLSAGPGAGPISLTA